MQNTGLDARAYRGAPAGYPRSDFPDGRFVLHPSEWDKNHWSFDEALKTRARKSANKPLTMDDSLAIIMAMTKERVGK